MAARSLSLQPGGASVWLAGFAALLAGMSQRYAETRPLRRGACRRAAPALSLRPPMAFTVAPAAG